MTLNLKKSVYTLKDFTWCFFFPKSIPKTSKTFRFPYLSGICAKRAKIIITQKIHRYWQLTFCATKRLCMGHIKKPLCHIIKPSIKSRKLPSRLQVGNLRKSLQFSKKEVVISSKIIDQNRCYQWFPKSLRKLCSKQLKWKLEMKMKTFCQRANAGLE